MALRTFHTEFPEPFIPEIAWASTPGTRRRSGKGGLPAARCSPSVFLCALRAKLSSTMTEREMETYSTPEAARATGIRAEGAARQQMPPEDQLCLLLFRGELSPDAERQALELLASPLGWQRLLERARTHEVLPLLYRNLQALGFAGVPEPVRAELADAYGNNAIRNVLLAKELARVLSLLGEAGVPVMPVKGTALAESLYGDPALRVCADIDILVPPRYFIEAF